jgi:hypothetical protein
MYVVAMTTYSIIPHSDGATFDVEVISDNGARQIMLGFPTEAEAEDWIASDRTRDSNAGRPAP